jgi:hypothetical protein
MPTGAERLVPKAESTVAAVGQPGDATVVLTVASGAVIGVGVLATPGVGVLATPGVGVLATLAGDALELPQAPTAALIASAMNANERRLRIDTRDTSIP